MGITRYNMLCHQIFSSLLLNKKIAKPANAE